MKIGEAINLVDHLMPNTFPDEVKLYWLTNMDRQAYEEVVIRHTLPDGFTEPDFDNYDLDTDLMIQEPYTDVYINLIKMKICWEMMDSERYSSEQQAYDDQYVSWQTWYNRNHMPNQYRPDYRGRFKKCSIKAT